MFEGKVLDLRETLEAAVEFQEAGKRNKAQVATINALRQAENLVEALDESVVVGSEFYSHLVDFHLRHILTSFKATIHTYNGVPNSDLWFSIKNLRVVIGALTHVEVHSFPKRAA